MINVAILSFNLTPTMMCRCYDTNTVLSVYGLISRGLIYSVTGCSLQAFPILPLSSLSGLSADSLLSSLFFSKQIASSITLRLEYLTQSLEDSPTLHPALSYFMFRMFFVNITTHNAPVRTVTSELLQCFTHEVTWPLVFELFLFSPHYILLFVTFDWG